VNNKMKRGLAILLHSEKIATPTDSFYKMQPKFHKVQPKSLFLFHLHMLLKVQVNILFELVDGIHTSFHRSCHQPNQEQRIA